MRPLLPVLFALAILSGCFPKQDAPSEIEQPDQSAPPTGFPAHKKLTAGATAPAQAQPPQQAQPPALSQPPTQASGTPTMITVQQKTTAFAVNDPSKPVGAFLPGTLLELGAPASAPGMIHVTYRPAGGDAIQALVKTDDLNRVPGPAAPSSATSPSTSPQPLQPKGLGAGYSPESNPNYKGLAKPKQ